MSEALRGSLDPHARAAAMTKDQRFAVNFQPITSFCEYLLIHHSPESF